MCGCVGWGDITRREKSDGCGWLDCCLVFARFVLIGTRFRVPDEEWGIIDVRAAWTVKGWCVGCEASGPRSHLMEAVHTQPTCLLLSLIGGGRKDEPCK